MSGALIVREMERSVLRSEEPGEKIRAEEPLPGPDPSNSKDSRPGGSQKRGQDSWHNRIVGYDTVSPDQLLANPRNWRVHPQFQQQALLGLLRDIGWVQDVIVNQRTGFVVDGHLRVTLALRENQPVPVKYVDLSDQEEASIIASLDPIACMAVADAEQLNNLLETVAVDEAVEQVLVNLANQEQPSNREPERNGLREVADELEGAFTLKTDMRFPSSEPFDIPPLRSDRLLELPRGLELWPGDDLRDQVGDGPYLLAWSTSCQTLDFTRTILAFYTDDVRFESVWATPERWGARLLNAGLIGAVAPNFSLWPGQAQAVHIWQVYRSRWVARYFQEAGISIVPDLNWAGPDDYDFCFSGVPVGAPCVSIQLQTFDSSRPDQVQRVRDGLLTALDRLRPEHLLCYASKAGRLLLSDLDISVPTTVLPTLMDQRREKLRKKKRVWK